MQKTLPQPHKLIRDSLELIFMLAPSCCTPGTVHHGMQELRKVS